MIIRNVLEQSRITLAAAMLIALAAVVATLMMILATPDATAQQGTPGTPSNVTVTRSDGSLTASWPVVSGATSYHITYTSDDGASWSLVAFGHPSTSITIDGVTNSLTYIVGVRGMNSSTGGNWRNSAPSGPFVPTSTPTATPTPEPTPDQNYAHQSRIDVTNSGLVTWKTNDWQFDPVPGIVFEYFELKWIEKTSTGNNEDWDNAFSHRIYDQNATSYQLPDLDSSKTYKVNMHVQLRTTAVEFPAIPVLVPIMTPTPTFTATPTMTPTATMTPTGTPTPTATPTGTASLDPPYYVTVSRYDQKMFVYWPEVSGATSYRVEYSSDDGGNWQLAYANDNAPPAMITGVSNSLTYLVRVRAQNSNGHSSWHTSWPEGPYLTPTPAPPDAPIYVIITRSDTKLHVDWAHEPIATSYNVEYSSDNGATWTTVVPLHPETGPIDINDVDNNRMYHVRVRSHNVAGHSDWKSNQTYQPWPPYGSSIPTTTSTPTPTLTPSPTPTPAPEPTETPTPTPTAVPTPVPGGVEVSVQRSADGESVDVSWTEFTLPNFSYYRFVMCRDTDYDGNSCQNSDYKSDPIYDINNLGPVTVTGLDPAISYGLIMQVWYDGSSSVHKYRATIPVAP